MNQKRREDLQIYLDALLSHFSHYHNHKENMAHLALAAQVTLACAFFSGKLVPLHCHLHQHFLLNVFVLLLSVALYFYAGWEMWLRRIAATIGRAIKMTRNKLIDEGYDYIPTNSTVQIEDDTGNFYKWAWFPWFCISDYDWENRGYPKELISGIKEALEKRDRHLDYLEVVTWILSITIIILIALSMWPYVTFLFFWLF